MTQDVVDEGSDPDVAKDQRFFSSTDEAGTPPGDRRFRPDVEGLRGRRCPTRRPVPCRRAAHGGRICRRRRVLCHFGVRHYRTPPARKVLDPKNEPAVLLWSAMSQNPPAASLVIVVTVLASYHWLGYLRGDQTAVDGRTASLFFANLHFASIGTNYLGAQQPPSPLQNFLVAFRRRAVLPRVSHDIPLVDHVRRRLRLRVKLTVALLAVIGGSFAWSIVQTSSNATGAYFSPFTRGMELALGGLVAVAAPYIARVPQMVAAGASWCGIAAIAIATLVFGSATPYPGAAVALPVLGSAAIIAGGSATPTWGVEWILKSDLRCSGSASCPIRCICGTGRFSSSLRSTSEGLLRLARTSLWMLVALGISILAMRSLRTRSATRGCGNDTE